MADVVSPIVRSKIMAAVGQKNTKPELLVRKFLFSHGFRYKINDKKLLGSPDIVLPKYKTIIFVHGCFWHSHDKCPNSKLPASNLEYWNQKISKNKIRDKKNIFELKKSGWKVLTIWECEITIKNRTHTLNYIMKQIRQAK